jgi:ABC-2 type transport system ATP-binding protein
MSLFECKNLTKKYSGNPALSNVDLQLEAGQIVGLLGPNGSGKTTMIKLANGLLRPDGGSILIDGMEPGPETKAMVAYLPDREYLPLYLPIEKLLKMYKDFFADFDEGKAKEMLRNLGLSEDIPMKKLSKGNREKIQLVLTMSRNAKIYFLDEPIAGVDPAARDYILRTIITNYCEDSLVIISTHLISDIESVLDGVVFLKNGQVILNKQADVIREEEGKSVDVLFREVFKC